jgi:hypothetical protein
VAYYEVQIDGGMWTSVGLDMDQLFESLSQGPHTVNVSVTDNTGNWNLSSVMFSIDTISPSVTITAPPDDHLFNVSDVLVTWIGNDENSGVDHYEVRIDEGLWVYVGASTSCTFMGLTTGIHTVEVKVYDLAWNQEMDSVTFIVDITPPEIEDLTTGTPTTGDEFVLEANVTDFTSVSSVYVEYWIDSEVHNNISMSKSGDDWTYTITLTEDAYALHYIFRANDTSDNWNATQVMDLAVVDDDKPIFWTDDTTATATTGEPLTFAIEVTDNIDVHGLWVEFWYGTGTHENVSMTKSAGNVWEHTIVVEDTLEDLYYVFHANDTSDNWNKTFVRGLEVIDDDKPVFGIDRTPTTAAAGDPFTFSIDVTDNVEVHEVTLEFWYGTGAHEEVEMTKSTGDVWECTVMLVDTLEDLHYVFHANDTSDNLNATTEKTIMIEDKDEPTFGFDGTSTAATTGDKFTFNIEVVDNIGVKDVYVEYWFDSETHMNESMGKVEDGVWNYIITLPNNLGDLHYIFYAIDSSINWNLTSAKELSVSDNDKPRAIAGDNIDCDTGTLVMFDGEESYDNVGIVNYTWHIVKSGMEVILYGDYVSFVFDMDGDYIVELTVKDAAGLRDTDIIWVNVTTPPDNDGDGIPDDDDYDDDNDGLTDFEEEVIGTSPLTHDTDGDGHHDRVDHFPLDPDEWVTVAEEPKEEESPLSSVLMTIILIIVMLILLLLLFLVYPPEKRSRAPEAEEKELPQQDELPKQGEELPPPPEMEDVPPPPEDWVPPPPEEE